MIESFIPVRYKNNFILRKNILIIYFNGLNLSIIFLEAYGKKRILKNFISKKISAENLQEESLEELLSQNISSSIKNFKYDHCRILLSGNNAIFKFLNLPFSDSEKIKMVAPFELESKLPFSLSECSIDSICIEKEKTELYQVISALIKQETISKIQEINASSNLKMDSLSLDVIETIIHHLENNELKDSHALAICNETSIIFIFYTNNKIINLKSFEIQEKSAYHAYFEIQNKKEEEKEKEEGKSISENEKIEETENNLKKEESSVEEKEANDNKKNETNNETNKDQKIEGITDKKENTHSSLIEIKTELPSTNILENNNNNKEKNLVEKKEETIENNENFEEKKIKINPKIKSLKENIVSSFNAILEQNEIKTSNFKIFLIGEDLNFSLFKEISNDLSVEIIPYEILKKGEIEIVFKDENLKNNFSKKDDILLLSSYLYSKSINFNLAHSEENNYKKNIIKKNLIFVFFLTILLFGTIIFLNILHLNNLNKQINKAELEGINFLKKEFDLQAKQSNTLEKAIKESENYVSLLENNLPFIPSESKYSFIKIFEKISENFSKEIKNLKLKDFKWKKKEDEVETVYLEGSVDDWESLNLLEENLKNTEIFEEITQSEDINFSYNLTIKNKD